MRSASKKGSARNALYLKLSREFLGNGHRPCEAEAMWLILERKIGAALDRPGCGGRGVQCHHLVNRSQARELVTEPRNFLAVCLHCHGYITDHPKWSKLAGLTLLPWQIEGVPEHVRFIEAVIDGLVDLPEIEASI